MAWIIVVLVLLVAVGPVLYLMPSRRDRRLAALREAARLAGLAVEVTTVPKVNAANHEIVSAGGVARDPRVMCVRYGLPLAPKLSRAMTAQHWLLDQDEWVPRQDLDGPSKTAQQADAALLDILRQHLGRFPQDRLGFSLERHMIWFYWTEAAPAEEKIAKNIKELLKEIEKDVRRLDTSRQPQEDEPGS